MDLLRAVRILSERISEFREQQFLRAPVAVRAPAEMRGVAAEIRAAAVLPEQRLAARGRAWADIGLGDAETPRSLLLLLASDLEDVTFDPSGRRLLVDPGRLTSDDLWFADDQDDPARLLMATGVRRDEPIIGHVLTHLAQQERRGGDDHLSDTTDGLLAGAAWSEGEANFVAVRYLFRSFEATGELIESALDPQQVLEGELVPPGLDRLPEVERDLLDFVYGEGFAQVAMAFGRGGWEGVERSISSRRTTRDLLHPEYRPLADPALPDAGISLPGAYRLVDRDSLGEQAVIVLIADLTGKDNLGLMAGDGWLGDALYRWEVEGQDPEKSGVSLWVSRWTSEEAVADFEYAYSRAIRARFPGRALTEVGEGRWRLDAGDRTYRIDRGPQELRIRIAPAELDRLLEPSAPAANEF